MVHMECQTHQGQRACALCFVFLLIVNFQTLACHKFSSHRGERSASRSSPPDTYGKDDDSHFRGSHQISPAPAPGGGSYVHVTSNTAPPGNRHEKEDVFLRKIFEKYGDNGVISFEGFEHLLKNLGIGELIISDHDIDDHSGHPHHIHSDHLENSDHRPSQDTDAKHATDDLSQDSHEGSDHFDYSVSHDHSRNQDVASVGRNHDHHDDNVQPHERQNTPQTHFYPDYTIKDSKIQGSGKTYLAISGQNDSYDTDVLKPTLPTPFQSAEFSTDAESDTAPIIPDNKDPDFKQDVTTIVLENGVVNQVESNRSVGTNKLLNSTTTTSALRQRRISDSAKDKREESLVGRFRSRRLSSVKPTPVTTTNVAAFGHSTIKWPAQRNKGRHAHRHALRHRKHGKVPQHYGQRPVPLDTVPLRDGEEQGDARRNRRDIRKRPVQDALQDTGVGKQMAADTTTTNNPDTDMCLSEAELFKTYVKSGEGLTMDEFISICPTLIYEIDNHLCSKPRPQSASPAHNHLHSVESLGSSHEHNHEDHGLQAQNDSMSPDQEVSQVPKTVWGYAFLAVIIISLVGLLGVAVVPIMQKVFYNHLLQFLVALAIGSLTGDALLHLIPHAFGSSHHASPDNGHEHSSSSHGRESHHEDIWRGLVGLGGIYFFFLTERVMGIVTDWRRKVNKQKRRLRSPKLFRTAEEHESEIGAKLSKHSDIVTSCEEIVMIVHPDKEMRSMADDLHEELHRDCEPQERDQLNHSHIDHHGHGHSHGRIPHTVASVAWMVIMGDGLHNFSDGLAIGAAFANSLTGGLSTSVAVFCHELPHEIGDFAVLLRAGMSVKQAVVYNCVSSVLCLLGMVIGVCLGNMDSVSLWVFSLTAGIFIYIALVDMLPELTSVQPKRGENPLVHLALQNVGMLAGAGIMLLIALYEDDIKFVHFDP